MATTRRRTGGTGLADGTTTDSGLRTKIVPGMLVHTVQLCIHCRQGTAGFWVSHKGGTTVHRPWCLSCCQALDRSRFDVIPFGG